MRIFGVNSTLGKYLIAGVVASALLSGCNSANDSGSSDQNQPPKPPNCPKLPELENLRLKNGDIAKVFIIEADGVKFYVPISWYKDRNKTYLDPLNSKDDSGNGVYNISFDVSECPGIVHKFVSELNAFGLGWTFVVAPHNTDPFIMDNFSIKSKIDHLSFGRPSIHQMKIYGKKYLEKESISYYSLGPSRTGIVVVPMHFVANYNLPKEIKYQSPEWYSYRSSVIDFVDWLRTPPKDRDNSRIFELGVSK